MANEPLESEEAERQRALDGAQRGAGEAEKELGVMPVPMQGPGQPGGDKGGPGEEKGNPSNAGKGPPGSNSGGSPGPGSHHDKGTADHKGGSTPEIDSKGFSARAGGKINKGAPMPGVAAGRTAGKPGETANTRGTGALGDVGPSEVGGVDRSDVPEEYREQVGRYFSP